MSARGRRIRDLFEFAVDVDTRADVDGLGALLFELLCGLPGWWLAPFRMLHAMPEVRFAAALQSHVSCPAQRVTAGSVRGALDAVFASVPQLRGYVFDDQGMLRPHVAVFVDGRAVADRSLELAVDESSQIFVVQALSGG